MKRGYLAISVIAITIFLDQWLKVYVVNNIAYNSAIQVFDDWFHLRHVHNPGMAFGARLSEWFPISAGTAKMILSIFRIVAIGFISYYLYGLVVKKAPKLLIASIGLILSGAIGNMIDSAVYGIIYNIGEPTFLMGSVVDMLSFNLFTFYIPDSIPIIGGPVNVFGPVFNLADSFISIGVILIILFQRSYFKNINLVEEGSDNLEGKNHTNSETKEEGVISEQIQG